MALVLKDRVKETTVSTGTGDVTLAGATGAFQPFSVIGDGNTTYYGLVGQITAQWEVGIGTYTLSTNTLSRDTVLSSSSSGALVDFSAGTKDVFVTYPSEKSVYLDSIDESNSAVTIGTTAVKLGETTDTLAGLESVEVTQDPTTALQLATKQYVDTLVASGIHFHQPVRVESPINLNATYDNGTAGVGATLTNAGTQEALVIDGITVSVADRVLVYEQTTQTQNGVYVVTDVGSISTNWILTRADDADTYVIDSPNGLSEGSTFFVQQGTTGAGETYTCNTQGTIVFGTTNITFAQVSSAQIYSAGTGLTLAGTQFSISNTTVTPASYGSASKTLTATVNAQGQLTALAAPDIAIQMSQVTSGTLPVTQGGTGFSSYAIGDIIYADTTTSFAKLGAVATGSVLISNGLTAAPSWSSSISLTGSVSAATATITANTSSDAFKITQTGTGNAFVVEDSASPDSSPFIIDTDGKVMIGTTTPGAQLEVVSSASTTARFISGTTITAITNSGGTSYIGDNNASNGLTVISGSNYAALRTANTDRVVVDSIGRVGIGTASPANALDVVATEPFVKVSTSSSGLSAFYQATNPLGSLYLGKDRDGSSGLFGSNGEYVLGCTGNYPLDFWTNTVKRLTIKGNGDIDIPGTSRRITADFSSSSPNNSVRTMFQSNVTNGNTVVTVIPNGTGTASQFQVNNNSDPANGSVGQFAVSSTAVNLNTYAFGTASSLPLVFNLGLTERFRIDTDGYITNTVKGAGLVQSQLFYALQADYVGSNVNTAQAMFGVGAPVVAGTVYVFEMQVVMQKSAGTTSHTMALLFGGTATVSNIQWISYQDNTGTAVPPANVAFEQSAAISTTEVLIKAATTTALVTLVLTVRGTVSFSADGTWIPQYRLSATGGAYSTKVGSWVKISPIGNSGTNVSIGGWA